MALYSDFMGYEWDMNLILFQTINHRVGKCPN